jgi:hypothetical protein
MRCRSTNINGSQRFSTFWYNPFTSGVSSFTASRFRSKPRELTRVPARCGVPSCVDTMSVPSMLNTGTTIRIWWSSRCARGPSRMSRITISSASVPSGSGGWMLPCR